jgi:hypothetical protein
MNLEDIRSRNGSVDIATGWAAEESGFDSRRGYEIFLFSTESTSPMGLNQPPI